MQTATETRKLDEALEVFRASGGTLRTSDALRLGIHPRTLYALRDAGILERLARGVHRLAELPPLSHPDLVTVAQRMPQAVVCLISALDFHDLTTRIPHAVEIAVKRGSQPPRLDFPPVQVHFFSDKAFLEGVETHLIDDSRISVYCAEKTLADCFKFRNRIGMETVVEALREYTHRQKPRIPDILRYAEVCRVENVMRPYLEALF